MLYSVQRLCEERVLVVLVERRALVEPRASCLIEQLQGQYSLPVLLVARDHEEWTGARALASFHPPEPHLYALLSVRDIDWSPLPDCFLQAQEA